MAAPCRLARVYAVVVLVCRSGWRNHSQWGKLRRMASKQDGPAQRKKKAGATKKLEKWRAAKAEKDGAKAPPAKKKR